MDQPAPDLLGTTFHHMDCISMGCVINRLETEINLCVICVAMRVWELILNHPEYLGCIDEEKQGAQT